MGWPLGRDTFGGGFVYGMQDDLLDRRPGRRASTTRTRCSTRTPSSSASRPTRAIARAARRRQDGVLRRQGDPRGRLVGDAAARPATASCSSATRRLPERPAPQGHPPGDEVRHAGGRDDLRGAARPATPRAERLARYEQQVEASWIQRGALGGAQLPPGLRPRPARRHAQGGARHGHRRPRLGLRRPAARPRPGHERMVRLDAPERPTPAPRRRSPPTASSPSTSSPTSTTRAPPTRRTSRSTCWCATPTSASTAAPREYGNPCQRFCPAAVYEMVRRRRRRPRASACRSTPATACTARPATSWTPTRSSPGCRPRAAAGRTTARCEGSRGGRLRQFHDPLLQPLHQLRQRRRVHRAVGDPQVARLDGDQPGVVVLQQVPAHLLRGQAQPLRQLHQGEAAGVERQRGEQLRVGRGQRLLERPVAPFEELRAPPPPPPRSPPCGAPGAGRPGWSPPASRCRSAPASSPCSPAPGPPRSPASQAKVRKPTRPPKKENSLVAPSTLTGTRFGCAPTSSQNSDSRGMSGS